MEKKKSLLSIFILVICTHIYLFAQLHTEENKIVAPKPTNSTTQIKLNKIVIKKQEVKKVEVKKEVKKKEIVKKKLHKTKSKNIIKHTKKKKFIKKEKPIKKLVHKKEPEKTFKEKIVEHKVQQKTKNKTKNIDLDKLKAIENEYLLKLKELIEKNKIYPNSAKRLNQTGKVYLNFTISKNGDIVNIKIMEKSKYKRLNNAAIEIINKIKHFEPIPQELNKSSWNITVPVLYQIIRS
ncbi:MAG: energy transducer TonB [Arcobacter sp.]|uniref:energy transducer TonB n=1 Tax=Arcobacter sp. TaxID=1872629 RepID=UPI003C73847C